MMNILLFFLERRIALNLINILKIKYDEDFPFEFVNKSLSYIKGSHFSKILKLIL